MNLLEKLFHNLEAAEVKRNFNSSHCVGRQNVSHVPGNMDLPRAGSTGRLEAYAAALSIVFERNLMSKDLFNARLVCRTWKHIVEMTPVGYQLVVQQPARTGGCMTARRLLQEFDFKIRVLQGVHWQCRILTVVCALPDVLPTTNRLLRWPQWLSRDAVDPTIFLTIPQSCRTLLLNSGTIGALNGTGNGFVDLTHSSALKALHLQLQEGTSVPSLDIFKCFDIDGMHAGSGHLCNLTSLSVSQRHVNDGFSPRHCHKVEQAPLHTLLSASSFSHLQELRLDSVNAGRHTVAFFNCIANLGSLIQLKCRHGLFSVTSTAAQESFCAVTRKLVALDLGASRFDVGNTEVSYCATMKILTDFRAARELKNLRLEGTTGFCHGDDGAMRRFQELSQICSTLDICFMCPPKIEVLDVRHFFVMETTRASLDVGKTLTTLYIDDLVSISRVDAHHALKVTLSTHYGATPRTSSHALAERVTRIETLVGQRQYQGTPGQFPRLRSMALYAIETPDAFADTDGRFLVDAIREIAHASDVVELEVLCYQRRWPQRQYSVRLGALANLNSLSLRGIGVCPTKFPFVEIPRNHSITRLCVLDVYMQDMCTFNNLLRQLPGLISLQVGVNDPQFGQPDDARVVQYVKHYFNHMLLPHLSQSLTELSLHDPCYSSKPYQRVISFVDLTRLTNLRSLQVTPPPLSDRADFWSTIPLLPRLERFDTTGWITSNQMPHCDWWKRILVRD